MLTPKNNAARKGSAKKGHSIYSYAKTIDAVNKAIFEGDNNIVKEAVHYALTAQGIESIDVIMTPLYGAKDVERARNATTFWVDAYIYAVMKELLTCLEHFADESTLGPALANNDRVKAMVQFTATSEFRARWDRMLLSPEHIQCIRAHSITGFTPPSSNNGTGRGRGRGRGRAEPKHGSLECFKEIMACRKGPKPSSKSRAGSANKGGRVLPLDMILETHTGLFDIYSIAQKVASGFEPDAKDNSMDVDIEAESNSDENTDAEGDRLPHERRDAPARAVKVLKSGGMGADQHLKLTKVVDKACEVLDIYAEASVMKISSLRQKLSLAQESRDGHMQDKCKSRIDALSCDQNKLDELRMHLTIATGTNQKLRNNSCMHVANMLTSPIPTSDTNSALQTCLNKLQYLIQNSDVAKPLLLAENQLLNRPVVEQLN